MEPAPVLHPKHLHLVNKEVREASLASMVGTADAEDTTEKEQEQANVLADEAKGLHQPGAAETQSAQQESVNQQVERRKLHRQLTGAEVPWFNA